MKTLIMCPRCDMSYIPNNERPGEHPGALSRTDNKTEICSDCGHDEALKEFFFKGCESQRIWPLPFKK